MKMLSFVYATLLIIAYFSMGNDKYLVLSHIWTVGFLIMEAIEKNKNKRTKEPGR